MTYEELNQYILNYLENDKTNSAIMLTGGWGTGKSYYIKHALNDVLAENNKDSVVVSLYGITDLSQISQAIYRAVKTKQAIKKNSVFFRIKSWIGQKYDNIINKIGKDSKEAINAKAQIVANSILTSIAGHYDINLQASDKDLNRLYRSLNFTDYLLIFEDVERASIDILEFLGYVNNFVEQDGVKALLVCNEDEIAKKEFTEKEPEGAQSNQGKERVLDYTDKAKAYLAYKEKTIIDTLVFEPDIKATIVSIIDDFNNENLTKYKSDEFCQNVRIIFYWEKTVNFRTFIFATQKFVDLLKYIDSINYPDDFVAGIYYSIIAFSIRYKEDRNIKWNGNSNYSLELGLDVCPLYKDCFDYIVNQSCAFSNFDEYYADYLELFNHQEIVKVFETYYLLPEKEVTKSLRELEIKVSKNEISIGIYPKLLLQLVTLEKNIDSDISSIVESMVQNVKGQSNRLGGKHAFYFATSIEDKDMSYRYNEIADRLLASAEDTSSIDCDFTYDVNNVFDDCSRIGNIYSSELKNKSFISRIDIVKLVELITNCSSEQIVEIRTLFQSIYKNATPEYDKVFEAERLKDLLKKLKDSDKSKLDKIQKLNIRLFENSIESYISNLLEE